VVILTLWICIVSAACSLVESQLHQMVVCVVLGILSSRIAQLLTGHDSPHLVVVGNEPKCNTGLGLVIELLLSVRLVAWHLLPLWNPPPCVQVFHRLSH